MQVAAILTVAVLGLTAAGSAFAASQGSDVDYMKANRCKGIAVATGADTRALDAYIKKDGLSRSDAVISLGQDAFTRAKRDAADANMKDRLAAELSGYCTAYMDKGKALASR